jgi:hypothetical protein
VASLGEYDTRLVFLPRSVAAADTFGEEVESWPDPPATVVEWWAAEVEPTAGEALTRAVQQTTGAVTFRLQGDATGSLTTYDRVKTKVDAVTYAVDGIRYDRKAHETVLTCSVAG